MTTPSSRRERIRQVLTLMRTLEYARGGYLIHGLPGWALTPDVEERARMPVPELLPAMTGMGLLEREDVRVPGRTRPVWAYRITDRGVRRLYELNGWPTHDLDPLYTRHPPQPHTPAPAHVPPRSLAVLCELRRAADDPATAVVFPGEPGWLTSRELDDLLPGGFSDLELAWLLRGALIERRHHFPLPTTRQPVVYYRITPAGRVVRPLRWRDPVNVTRLLADG